MTMIEQNRILITATNIILTKVQELDELISTHAKSSTSRDIMAHKLNAIRRIAENTITESLIMRSYDRGQIGS